jgi:hypothetical protein
MSTHDDAATIETATAETKPRRKYKVTPTPRQRRAARIMADIAMGKRPDIKNQGDIIVEAGYAATLKDTPKTLLNTRGVETALADNGFSPETAKNVVKMILESNDAAHKDRLKAADMVFKVHGTYAAEKTVNLNIEHNTDDTRLLELAERLRNAQK